jgi:hypothetical protein
MSMRQFHHETVRRGGALLLVLWASACGGSPERAPPAPSSDDLDLADLVHYDQSSADARDIYASGACEEGATRVCRVYLPSHNGVQPCFVGEQTCESAHWGECGSGTVVDANDGDTQIDPDSVER